METLFLTSNSKQNQGAYGATVLPRTHVGRYMEAGKRKGYQESFDLLLQPARLGRPSNGLIRAQPASAGAAKGGVGL